MSHKQNKRQTGTRYEKLCADYLTASGYQLLAMNYRCRFGEIDLIARDGSVLVFIEVKFRRNAVSGNPFEAVSYPKQVRICRTADHFRVFEGKHLKNDYRYDEMRFDVIGIKGREFRHITNAFSYIPPHGCSFF